MSIEKITTQSKKSIPYQFMPESFEQLHKLATMISSSDLAPKDYKGKPANCLVAMQMGAEVGLMPMQSLQNIAVINGRPSIWGDAALALVMSSQIYESIKEWEEGDLQAGTLTAYCNAKRKDGTQKEHSFSIKDAMQAGLWKKAGPWTQYPRRMLQMRARSFAIRDVFPDALKGLSIAEEVIDLPQEDYHIISSEINNKKKGTSGILQKLDALENKKTNELKENYNSAKDDVEESNSSDLLIDTIEMFNQIQEKISIAKQMCILSDETINGWFTTENVSCFEEMRSDRIVAYLRAIQSRIDKKRNEDILKNDHPQSISQ